MALIVLALVAYVVIVATVIIAYNKYAKFLASLDNLSIRTSFSIKNSTGNNMVNLFPDDDYEYDCDNHKVGRKSMYEGRHNKKLHADLYELEVGCHHSSAASDNQKIKVKGKERSRKARDNKRNGARTYKQAQRDAFYAEWAY